MTTEKDPTTQQTINLARKLERLLYQRRSMNKKLARLDADILTTRRFLGSLPALGDPAPSAEGTEPLAHRGTGFKARKRTRKKK